MSSALTCVLCSVEIPCTRRSRLKRIYCSNACRQKAYRQRARLTSDERPEPIRVPNAARWQALDSFIGRDEELATLNRYFRQHRLITLFGPAGAGKTRAATEFATSAAQMFPDGVHLIELSKITDPDLVAQAVALTVRAADRLDNTVSDSLPQVLHDKNALLILDNCEHLVDTCSELVDTLLHHCPQIRILTTSRETLRLPGEKVFSIGPLAVEDAMQLFTDRALNAAPALTLHDGNREFVKSICDRLDRLPLAIELGARLVRLFPLDYIVDRLNNRFDLLTSGARSADAKHHSLYAAIDWSYSLLNDNEQVLLRRLSVLPGGFDVELATAVSADLELPVIELISSLESKSLLATAPDASGLPRFRQWESVRAYAHERLIEFGELPDAVEHLVSALTAIAAPLTECFTPSRKLVDRLLAEQDNLQKAVDHLRGRNDGREPLLAGALARCRTSQGVVAKVHELLEASLRVKNAPPPHRVVALNEATWSAAWQGNRKRALELGQQSAEVAKQVNLLLRCQALTGLAYAYQELEDYQNALIRFAECLDLIRLVGDPQSIALCGHNLAWSSILADDLDTGEETLAEILPLYESIPELSKRASLWHTAGALYLRRGDYSNARRYFTTGLTKADPTSVQTPYLIEGSGLVGLRTGRVEHGLRLLGAAERLRRANDAMCDVNWAKYVEAELAAFRSRMPSFDVDHHLDQGRRLSDAHTVVDLAVRQRPPSEAPQITLGSITEREQQVATLVAHGKTNVEIARQLRISERTVESHLDHVRTKLSLRSRAHVAAWVTQQLSAAR